jgi:hypothetical protein
MMRMLHFARINGYLALDPDECREFGRSLAERYQNADPFPHIVMDQFLDPDVLLELLADFPSSEDKPFFGRDQERLKFQYQPHEALPGSRGTSLPAQQPGLPCFLEGSRVSRPDFNPYFRVAPRDQARRSPGRARRFNIHGRLKWNELNLLVYLNETGRRMLAASRFGTGR